MLTGEACDGVAEHVADADDEELAPADIDMLLEITSSRWLAATERIRKPSKRPAPVTLDTRRLAHRGRAFADVPSAQSMAF